jgi:hypothetical protein
MVKITFKIKKNWGKYTFKIKIGKITFKIKKNGENYLFFNNFSKDNFVLLASKIEYKL